MKITTAFFVCFAFTLLGCESRKVIHQNAVQDMGLTQLTPIVHGRYGDGACYAKDKYDNCYFIIVSTTAHGDTIAVTTVPCKPIVGEK